jgi:hypothetical protein
MLRVKKYFRFFSVRQRGPLFNGSTAVFFSIVSFDFFSDALHHVFHVGTDGVNFKLSKSAWLTIEEEEHWSLTFRAFDRMLSIHRALSYVHFWSRNASGHKV